MDTVLVLLAVGLLATLHLMSVITLKNKMEALEGQINKNKGYLIEIGDEVFELVTKIELQSGKNDGKLEEFTQRIKEVGVNIESLSYEVNGIRELITSTSKDVEKTVETEAGRILFTPLKVKYEGKGV